MWKNRFETEGLLWGQAHSTTAEALMAHLTKPSRILDFGFGYGRDVFHYASRGHTVVGFEQLCEHPAPIQDELLENQDAITLIYGTRFNQLFAAGTFDAISSHRVIHLLQKQDRLDFYTTTAHLLKPAGVLLFSARNHHDYRPKEMLHHTDGTTSYIERPQHRFTLLSDELIHQEAGAFFKNISLSHKKESDAQQSDSLCHLTQVICT